MLPVAPDYIEPIKPEHAFAYRKTILETASAFSQSEHHYQTTVVAEAEKLRAAAIQKKAETAAARLRLTQFKEALAEKANATQLAALAISEKELKRASKAETSAETAVQQYESLHHTSALQVQIYKKMLLYWFTYIHATIKPILIAKMRALREAPRVMSVDERPADELSIDEREKPTCFAWICNFVEADAAFPPNQSYISDIVSSLSIEEKRTQYIRYLFHMSLWQRQLVRYKRKRDFLTDERVVIWFEKLDGRAGPMEHDSRLDAFFEDYTAMTRLLIEDMKLLVEYVDGESLGAYYSKSNKPECYPVPFRI